MISLRRHFHFNGFILRIVAAMIDRSLCTSSDGSSEGSNESAWLDVESDEESQAVISLFDSQSFQTIDEMFEYCKQHHDFDFPASIRRLQLDFLGAVKLVNFIRHCVEQGQSLPDVISQGDIDNDIFLKPVLENDAVLFSLGDVLEEAARGDADAVDEQTRALVAHNRQLEAELVVLQSSFANYRLTVQRTLDKRWGNDDNPDSKPHVSCRIASAEHDADYYFQSYATHGTSRPP